MTDQPKTTAIILTKNEEAMIEGCLRTLSWCDEVLVIDDNSTDDTAKLAEKLGARVVEFSHPSFARKRNEALKHAEGDWLFYIDADERVTPTLAKEILVNIETDHAPALTFKRINYCYGHELQHGGWGDDQVTRVFKKTALEGWEGDIHESPVYQGKAHALVSSLLHFTHRNTEDNLRKSADWTKREAELLFKAGEKPITFLTLIRKGVMEFIRRAIFKKGRKDGLVGLIEALVQGTNRIMVYIQVWELQQKPSLPDRYTQREEELQKLWQQEQEL
jgi:glycosyltransferase involved in cell wall biosynthesis